jgi:phage major head subunit gpT-like protein
MIVNSPNLRSLYTGFSAAYQGAFAAAAPKWARVALRAPSSTRSNEYGWLGQLPRIREWLGDRVVQNIHTHDYTIKNKPWELTIGVDRDDIEDDNIGIYSPLFAEMGRATAVFPDELVFALLKAGFATNCYDGQYFFDTDHPVLNEAGVPTSVSNSGGGGGTGWYLLDTTRPIKPIVFQDRKAFEFVRMDAPTDEVVFNRKEYRYGVDGRCNVGFGLWQMAYGSKQTLDADAYGVARAAMMGMKGDYGRPLNIMPNLMVVPPSLEGAAREILMAERNAAGETNIWRGSAELEVVPWLA